ncbi:hypothetical protein ABZ897_33225 [Nonomuraea sp. NPDC046802]|uniref:hypothetical protein n=1 Tax=Nonomuraea sp. NPDC046802 TaxID=3154919 RepID=UPI0033FC87F5
MAIDDDCAKPLGPDDKHVANLFGLDNPVDHRERCRASRDQVEGVRFGRVGGGEHRGHQERGN